MNTYPPVDRCIYCGTDQGPFGDEHIIPFGLGGDCLLPKGSCRACEKITSAFEGTCQRRIMGEIRIKRGLPTRRKKDRPKTLNLRAINPDNSVENIPLPIDEHPSSLTLFKFEKARALLGLPYFEDERFRAKPWFFGPTPREMLAISARHGGRNLSFGAFEVAPFFRMLAKIAHSYAAAEIGIPMFRPVLPDLILGKSHNYGHWIGGSLDDPPPAHETDIHRVNWRGITIGRVAYVVVDIRLFADMGAPIYRAVAGVAHPALVEIHARMRAEAQRA